MGRQKVGMEEMLHLSRSLARAFIDHISLVESSCNHNFLEGNGVN